MSCDPNIVRGPEPGFSGSTQFVTWFDTIPPTSLQVKLVLELGPLTNLQNQNKGFHAALALLTQKERHQPRKDRL